MAIGFDDFKAYLMSGNTSAPESIQRFDLITKISIGLGILGFLFSLLGQPIMMMAAGGGLIVALVILLLYIFMFYMIVMQAQEWAKWVFTVLIAIGLLGFIASLGMMSAGMLFMGGAIAGVISLAQMALNIYAVVLLFRPDSSRFFKGR